ncbi:MAG: N-acetylmuramoyl-L-alanine amidase [Clostridia bacterium]|nr:N-acetylmuramoyl-L-alanine amidase [Clostridia bacterium]
MVKNRVVKSACALCVCVIFFSLLGCEANQTLAPAAYKTIVIDAGHGGIDGGVTGVNSGALESDINLEIAKKLKTALENAGFRVELTRSTSGGLYGALSAGFKLRDMNKRAQIINSCDADLVISVHQNKFSQEHRRGGQVFYQKGSASSAALAANVQKQLNELMPYSTQKSIIAGDFFILRQSPCPAVIVECGFLSNGEDEKLLLTSEHQIQLATAILSAVTAYFYSV